MSKYHAVNCRHQFPDCAQGHASLREHRRAAELRLLELAGEIRNLREQVRVDLCDADCRHKRHIVYVADFEYKEQRPDPSPGGPYHPLWVTVLEDCKGVETAVFKLKRHLLEDQGMELRLS